MSRKMVSSQEDMEERREESLTARTDAANKAYYRNCPITLHFSNDDEDQYRFQDPGPAPGGGLAARPLSVVGGPNLIANFTKGLPHHPVDGLVYDPDHSETFKNAIEEADPAEYINTPLGPPPTGLATGAQPNDFAAQALSGYTKQVYATNPSVMAVRAWESEGAGQIHDLEGPDAQAVTMPPAPGLTSAEFVSEVAEVYEMALLRDLPFNKFKISDPTFRASVNRLQNFDWFNNGDVGELDCDERERRRELTMGNAFRGTAPGDDVGPYLSQFLCRGFRIPGDKRPESEIARGAEFAYGSLVIANEVQAAVRNKDYMTTWEWWVDVQNGADLGGSEEYKKLASGRLEYQIMATPRDLATYVHYDALYEAYLNACLMLLSIRAPFDKGIPFQLINSVDHQQGFAHFGGPHILSLVTEVATRALKAVRFQKFNIHRRLRPEAIAGRIHRWKASAGADMNLSPVEAMAQELENHGTLGLIREHNKTQNNTHAADGRGTDASAQGDVYLLPMAFPEGSPMHPTYGAGHATVAGACVTVLKAFFDTDFVLPKPYVEPRRTPGGNHRLQTIKSPDLTVGGELNKLAANISIARNWAGVHYFTDYFESLKMGEEIALGILEEQKITFADKEMFSMTVPRFFGGGTVTI